MREAQDAVAKKNYDLAEELSLKMIRMKLDTSSAKKVLTQIDSTRKIDDTVLKTEPATTTAAVPTLVKPDAEEEFDSALLTLINGDYRKAITAFTALEQKKPSAKIHFYFGCALAGFGFTNGKDGEQWLERAKLQFSKMKGLDSTFKPHVKYISPRIVEFYNQNSRS